MLRRKPLAEGETAHDTSGIPGGVLFQMVAVLREDINMWAIPGGMVRDGEPVRETLRRRFADKAGALTDPHKLADLEDDLDLVFAEERSREIYRGYVDDPRNTDNAWVESTVCLFLVDDELASRLTLSGRWLDVDAELLAPGVQTLYADHKEFVKAALLQQKEYLGIV